MKTRRRYGDADTSKRILAMMRLDRVSPSVVSCNQVLRACAKAVSVALRGKLSFSRSPYCYSVLKCLNRLVQTPGMRACGLAEAEANALRGRRTRPRCHREYDVRVWLQGIVQGFMRSVISSGLSREVLWVMRPASKSALSAKTGHINWFVCSLMGIEYECFST